MAKKRMPIYGIIDILMAILAYNLAKYQYFSRDQVYSISTIKLHILCNFQFDIM